MICKICEKDFKLNHPNQKLCSIECKKEARRRTLKKHKHTDKWEASNKKWVQSKKRKENEKRYKESEFAKYLIKRKSKVYRERVKGRLKDWFDYKSTKGCIECGSMDNLTIDHVVPMSIGGDDSLENLQVMCLSCNCKKGDRWQS